MVTLPLDGAMVSFWPPWSIASSGSAMAERKSPPKLTPPLPCSLRLGPKTSASATASSPVGLALQVTRSGAVGRIRLAMPYSTSKAAPGSPSSPAHWFTTSSPKEPVAESRPALCWRLRTRTPVSDDGRAAKARISRSATLPAYMLAPNQPASTTLTPPTARIFLLPLPISISRRWTATGLNETEQTPGRPDRQRHRKEGNAHGKPDAGANAPALRQPGHPFCMQVRIRSFASGALTPFAFIS